MLRFEHETYNYCINELLAGKFVYAAWRRLYNINVVGYNRHIAMCKIFLNCSIDWREELPMSMQGLWHAEMKIW